MSDWSQAAIDAAGLLDDLEQEYGDEAKVGCIAIVIEVTDTDADGDEWTGIHYRCSDSRRWIQAGLFLAAGRAVLSSSEASDEE